jgi:hypothetical protein
VLLVSMSAVSPRSWTTDAAADDLGHPCSGTQEHAVLALAL